MILRAEKLTKYYKSRAVVNEVDLELTQGEIVGLLGPNGAGKTTTFHLLLGLVKPDKGKVYLETLDSQTDVDNTGSTLERQKDPPRLGRQENAPEKKNLKRDITFLPLYLRAREGIGYLAQEPSIFRHMTVEENILSILESLKISPEERKDKLNHLLNELGIISLSKQKAELLSGGEKRRCEIARALVKKPKFFLLDEPFVGIDPITVSELQEIITGLRAQGLGILITDHNVRDTLQITDRAYIMYEGKILLQGTAKELLMSESARKVYLGEKFQM